MGVHLIKQRRLLLLERSQLLIIPKWKRGLMISLYVFEFFFIW